MSTPELSRKLLQASLSGQSQEMPYGNDWTLKIKPLVDQVGRAVAVNTSNIQKLWQTIQQLPLNQKVNVSFDGRPYQVEKRGYLPRIEKAIVFTGKSLFYLPDSRNDPKRKIWLKGYQVRQCCLGKMLDVTGCKPEGQKANEYCAKKLIKYSKPLKSEMQDFF